MTTNRALGLTALANLYHEFAAPFSLADLSSPSCSILRPKSRIEVPVPFAQAGSIKCHPLSNFPVPDVAIAYLPRAILSREGAVIFNDRHIIAESVEGELSDSGFALTDGTPHLNLDDVQDSDEVVLAISKNGTWNYSLFLSGIVPLAFVAALNATTEHLRVPMLFREFMSAAMIEMRIALLETVGIVRERIFTPEPGFTRYKGVVFVKVNERYQNHRVSPLLSNIAGQLRSGFADARPPVSRRLYISRQKAPSRKVANFAALTEQVLVPFDLHPVELEQLGLADQIDLFSKADLVVAEHGAALVNTMFMRPGSVVIEMIPEPLVGRWMYRLMSHYGRLNYACAAFATPPDWVWYRDDYTVPCDLYRQLLERTVTR